MSIAKKAIVSTLWTSGLNYFAMVVGFVLGILRDQFLMPDENGIYMYGLAVVDIVFVLAAVSFNISLIQSKEDKEDLYSTAFLLTIALSVLMIIATLCTAYILDLRGTLEIKTQAFIVLSGFSILNLFTILFSSYLEKQLEYKKIAKVNFLSLISFPIFSYILVKAGWGAWGMVFGYCSSFIVSFFGMLSISKYPISLRFNPKTAKWFLSMGWKLIFSRGMEVIFVRYGTLVTESLLGTSLQGSYGRALKYWEMAPQTVAPAVVTVALPTYSKLQDETEKLSQAFSMVFFFLVRILTPFVLIFAVLADSFFNILGDQWKDAVIVLRVLSIGALLSPMFENMKQLLYAKGKPEAIVKIRIIQLIIFLPAMYLLVLSFGISGAAMTIVLNYIIGVVGVSLIIRKEVSIQWIKALVPPLIFAGISSTLVLIFPIPYLNNGAFVQFALEALYLVGIFIALELFFERSQLKSYAIFVRKILSEREA